ncbi:MAG: hypothetical protein M0Z66_16060 [Thermaerobacter sp.]|nr:hypothetical protein [Thermaerobacter sp.]
MARKCIGFGAFSGKCEHAADGRNPYWCERCNTLRIEHINRQVAEIRDALEAEEG